MEAPHESALARRPPPYRWTGLLSLALHLGLLGAVVVTSTVQACGPKLPPPTPAIAAKLVRLGKPRDPKLLPRKPADPPPPPPAAREAPVPVPQAAPSPSVKVAAPSPAPASPPSEKPGQKLDDIMKRFATQSTALAKAEEAIGALDGDPEGDAEQAAEGERYLALVEKRIKDRYQIPSTIPDAERVHLRTGVIVHIDPAGKIFKHEVEEPSSNALFDSAVIAAIDRAATVPPPPEHLRDVLRKGIRINFRP